MKKTTFKKLSVLMASVLAAALFAGCGSSAAPAQEAASAASSAAAAYGMNELFDCPLSDEEMVVCAMEGENLASGGYHADNAAPALLGGIILIRGYEPLDIIQLPIPGNFYCAVVHPKIMVSTKAARSILPKAVPMHDAISQWGNVGGLIAGLYSGNIGLVGPHRIA